MVHIPLRTRVERHRFEPPRVRDYDVVVRGLNPAHDGLRIAHLTDLHVGMLTPDEKIERAIERTRFARPDLVVMTGDFVCYHPKFVGRLGELVRGLDMPVYVVLGNHDHWTDGRGVKKAMERAGYAVLTNTHTELTLRGERLTVVGIDDVITGNADVKRAFKGVRQGGSRLVLTHLPGLADQAAAYGPSMIFAGHTHGGHVNIPRITSAIARRLGNRYLKGFFEIEDSLLYVNCGVGSSSVPFRAGAPSEVAFLTLRASSASATDDAARRGKMGPPVRSSLL